MSWHCSQALVAAFSEANSWDGELSAPLKSTGTDGASLPSARMTASLSPSPSGMTSAPSTDSHGEDVLTWYLAGFLVKPIPRRLEVGTSRMISGRKCGESWQRSLPGTYLPRTSKDAQSTGRQRISRRWVTKPALLPLPRQTWAQTTAGPDIGYVHTPTVTANFAAPSMQKWACCRAFVQAFGAPSPEAFEHLMGWPTGWTALKPLAMDKFHAWRRRHGDL